MYNARTLNASCTSPHRLPVVSTWYTIRFEGDGVEEEDGDGVSESEGVEDIVVEREHGMTPTSTASSVSGAPKVHYKYRFTLFRISRTMYTLP